MRAKFFVGVTLPVVAGVAFGLGAASCESTQPQPQSQPQPQPSQDVIEIIHEDDPRWDCKTMGNMICGGAK